MASGTTPSPRAAGQNTKESIFPFFPPGKVDDDNRDDDNR